MSAGAAALRRSRSRSRPVSRSRPRSLRTPRLPKRRFFVIAFLALIVLAAGYRFYLRDSSLVAVNNVRVEGIDSDLPGAAGLRAELEQAAGGMTTLHVQPELLRDAVAGNPLVQSVTARADFPHKLVITVAERRPSAIVGAGSGATAVAGDGVVLAGVTAGDLKLPRLAGVHPPKGPRLSGEALGAARVLGAAPAALVPYLDAATLGDNGVTVQLTDGIELRFGDSSNAARKWAAAAGVLADPSITTLDYVDLSAPNRPAVGGSGHTLAPAP